MAKEIIIPGLNLLTSLADAWGGENRSGKTQRIYGADIPDGYKWGVNFEELERFIKTLFNGQIPSALSSGKIGCLRTWEDGDEELHLLGFASLADYETWFNDHESVTPISNIIIPKGGGANERFRAVLESAADANTPLVVLEPSLDVTLRFMSMIYSGGQYIDLGENGTITIYRSTDGGVTWSPAGTAPIRSGVDTVINVGRYLVKDRETMIRAKASFTYNGNVAESVFVNLCTATYTVLSVKNMTDYTRPLNAGNGYISLAFAVLGSADKTLHVEVSASEAYDTSTPVWSASEYIDRNTEYPETSTKGLTVSNTNALTHGVHTVKAWVTCDDGTGNELSSDVVINRFMVINPDTTGADLTTPRLMLQEVVGRISNYVDSRIASFAVWIPDPSDPTAPSSDPLQLVIRLTDGSGGVEYYHNEPTVYNNISYPIQTTVEIEGESPLYYAYLHIYRGSINFMQESTGRSRVTVEVDNSESYTVVPGADFVLNPKNRDNGESNPCTIINQRTGQVVDGSTFEGFNKVTDLWMTAQDGQKVLRVLAGSRVTINYEPFEQFKADGSSQMTLELDFAVRNITQEDEPMIDVSQVISDELLGMRLLPLIGVIKCVGYQIDDTQNFGWQEGVRTRLTLVLDPSLTVKANDELTWQQTWNNKESRPLSLAKVYLNAVPYRELVYANNQAETAQGRLPAAGTWCRGNGHGGIKIGNPHADIDIYSIRCYKSALSAENVLQNYIASLPDAASKQEKASRNKITTNGRISYEKAKTKYRCLTLVGQDQYKGNQDKKNGYPCYWRIDHDTPSLSGTIGKAAYQAYVDGTLGDKKCLMVTAQGTTANTYWDNNEQTKIEGITYKVNIPFSKVHADFGWNPEMSSGDGCECPMYLNGTRIEGTSYASLSDDMKALVTIDVLDGWFDGAGWSEYVEEMGMYHGQFYTSHAGGAKCSKLVNKINYASSMQSHKMGATRFYHDVMMEVTGGNSVTASGARFAVYEECFMLFTEHPDDNGKVEFRGLCTFGDGKFDKAVFGLKSKSGTFAFEGLQNNIPLCDFRVPADGAVTYDPDEESWMYAGVKSFEYGLGKTKTVDGKKFPTDAAEAAFRRFVNFVYCHNTSLRPFVGSFDQFTIAWNGLDEDSRNEMLHYQYWCTDDFKLRRYDFTAQEWTGAGTWDQDSMAYTPGDRDLRQDTMTRAAYLQWQSGQDNGDFDKLNEAFINAIANHGRENFGSVADVENFKTHYNVVNFLLAGTDNCSKNMYYQYDPDTGLIGLDGDDLDSILPTDNNGNNTKVYFLDRIHDVMDYVNGHKPQIDYEGRASALFNFIEVAYEKNSDELRTNMRTILQAMIKLCGGNNASLMGCFEKYFFSIQTYFPEVAWCEQARLRYEWPKSFGYISTGEQARSIDPITQQVGNQIEAERQYMKRRIALIASYAAWGQFAAAAGETGLSDAGSSLSMVPGSGRTGNNYRFSLVPHQWIYPVGKMGNGIVDPHIRVAPGINAEFVNSSLSPIGGDQSAVLAASNYYRKFGNLGTMVVGNSDFQVEANRLTDLVAEPAAGSTAFSPQKLSLTTPNLRRMSLRGCSALGGTLNLSALTRLESIDLWGTSFTSVELPSTNKLTMLSLPGTLTSLVIDGQPSLLALTIEGIDNLETLRVTGNTAINAAVRDILDDGWGVASEPETIALSSLTLREVNWTVGTTFLKGLLAVDDVDITGRITVTGIVNMQLAMRVLAKFPGVFDAGSPLTIIYANSTAITSASLKLDQDGVNPDYIDTVGDYPLLVTTAPPEGNDLRGITWEIDLGLASGRASVSDDGVLHVEALNQVVDGVTDKNPITVTAVITTASQTIRAEFVTRLYHRDAEVGDYLYADGSFSDRLKSGKTVVARCFYVNPNDKTDRLAVSVENIVQDAWGLSTYGSGATGITLPSGYNAYDTPVENTTSAGTRDVDNVQSLEDFDSYDAGTAMRDFGLVTLDEGIGQFSAGDTIHVGHFKTLQIINHRDKVLQEVSGDSMVGGVDLSEPIEPIGSKTERDVLLERIQTIVSAKGDKYRQFYYPAASFCHAFQPSIRNNQGEVLAEHLKAHNWFLPSVGEMARIYWLQTNGYFAGEWTALGSDYYHTSSENNQTTDWLIKGNTGEVYGAWGSTAAKTEKRYVRAVVAF